MPFEEEPQRESRRQRHYVTLCQARRPTLLLCELQGRKRHMPAMLCANIDRASARGIRLLLPRSALRRSETTAELQRTNPRRPRGLISVPHAQQDRICARMIEDTLTLASSLHRHQVAQHSHRKTELAVPADATQRSLQHFTLGLSFREIAGHLPLTARGVTARRGRDPVNFLQLHHHWHTKPILSRRMGRQLSNTR